MASALLASINCYSTTSFSREASTDSSPADFGPESAPASSSNASTSTCAIGQASRENVGRATGGLMDGWKRRMEKKKAGSRTNRKKRRTGEKQDALEVDAAQANIRPNILRRYDNEGPSVQCNMKTEEARVAKTAFVALNDKKPKAQLERTYTLAEVTGEGSELSFRLQEWDGEKSILILDKSGRIIAVLAGWPEDDDWPMVHHQAAEALQRCRQRCSIPEANLDHRRGEFAALSCGVSHGGGQPHPMNLKHEGSNKDVLEELNNMSCFQRIAGFGSSVMKRRAPDLYRHYVEKLGQLHRRNPSLKHPFRSSVFSAATYNLGPHTVCYEHKDLANIPYGWCAVTALGSFDYKKGGHLILWDCRLVIEFPPGATVLLPSAIVAHSNISISLAERRYSFAQYSAGALFRWVENNNMRAVDYRATLSPVQREMQQKKNAERWALGLSLLPVVNLSDTQLVDTISPVD